MYVSAVPMVVIQANEGPLKPTFAAYVRAYVLWVEKRAFSLAETAVTCIV